MIDAVAPFADFIIVTKDSEQGRPVHQDRREDQGPADPDRLRPGLVEIMKKVFS